MIYNLYSFNINGIRAIGKKGFWDWMKETKPDIICLQETKADTEIMAEIKSGHPGITLYSVQNQLQNGLDKTPKTTQVTLTDASTPVILDTLNYNIFWHSCSMKKGYSGTAILFKKNLFPEFKIDIGIGDEKFDVEGRLTMLQTPYFTLLNGYYPQGGREGRIPYKIEFYHKVLEIAKDLENKGQKVILCGDFNTTVADIDLARPKENRKTTGCLPEEREALGMFFEAGFIDSFRYFYPDLSDKYSYWDQITRARERNVGWRIDYFLVSQKLIPNLKDAYIYSEVMGSDHCPVAVKIEV